MTLNGVFWSILAILGVAVVWGCSRSANGPATDASASSADAAPRTPLAKAVQAGSLLADEIRFHLAVYSIPSRFGGPPPRPPRLELFKGLQGFEQVEQIPEGIPAQPLVSILTVDNPRDEFPPPPVESLMKYFGRGLSEEQAQAVQDANRVVVFQFAYKVDENLIARLKSALELVRKLATDEQGLIYDVETREMFTPKAWQERRMNFWRGDVPDVSTHITIHNYQEGQYQRAVTLGMAKLGLPDLVVEGFPRSLGRNVGHTINLVAQALAEGAVVPRTGEFDLDFRQIRQPEVRDAQLRALEPQGTGKALLQFVESEADEGDPDNRLIEIRFDHAAGPDTPAKIESVLAGAFGHSDSVTRVSHDEALLAASQRARSKLPALREAFNRGLAPDELVLVKAPFKTPSGDNEWMWVEVSDWNGDAIRGTLQNDPFDISTLHAGQEVDVSQAEIFDYLFIRTDGTQEGNETGRLMEAQAEQ